MLEIALRWVIGGLVALGVGHVALKRFLPWVRERKMGLTEDDLQRVRPRYRVPSWLTGLVERLFFAVLVALGVQGAATAMIGWLAAKMVANWNRPISEKSDDEDRHVRIGFAFSALVAGLVSMLFALVGGLIAGGKIWYWPW